MSEAASQASTAVEKLREAEAVQREAVSLLEITGPQSLLADALIRHGITLARLGETERAEVDLERAMIVAVQLGTLDKAGVAALTMIEELDGLSAEALMTNYERANTWLADFSELRTVAKSQRCSQESARQIKGPVRSRRSSRYSSSQELKSAN